MLARSLRTGFGISRTWRNKTHVQPDIGLTVRGWHDRRRGASGARRCIPPDGFMPPGGTEDSVALSISSAAAATPHGTAATERQAMIVEAASDAL
jgi:hypothetical protein